jgi:hypothetical protein
MLRIGLRIEVVTLALLFVFAHEPLAGQRLNLPPDSMEWLTRDLAPQARAAARQFLAGNDSVARVTLRAFRFDPAAGPLLLAILARDPSAQVRQSLDSSRAYYAEYWAAVPGILPALVERVKSDADPAIVTSATGSHSCPGSRHERIARCPQATNRDGAERG